MKRAARNLDLQSQRARSALVFLAPMMLILAVVAFWPLMRSFWFSVTDTSLTDLYSGHWIGFDNFLRWKVLGSGRIMWRGVLADPVWWAAVYNTAVFSVASVSIGAVFGVVMALVLNAEYPFRGLVRAAVLIPWAIPTIVSARIWGWMLNDQFGIINDMFMAAGLISDKVTWIAQPRLAMAWVVVVDVWKNAPFVALLVLAALQMISKDIYEAARLDGINPVKVFFRVTLPLIWPALLVALLFRLLDALRVFDIIYVLTANAPGTKTMSIVSYENMINFDKFGYGSAQSTVLFFIVAVCAVVIIQAGRLKLADDNQ